MNGSPVVITIPVDTSVTILETINGSGQVTDVTLENITDNNDSGDVTNGVPVAESSTLKVGSLQAALSVKRGLFT